jgi:hypothetical protein
MSDGSTEPVLLKAGVINSVIWAGVSGILADRFTVITAARMIT